MRAHVEKKLAQKEKEKEESLRLLAQKACEESAGIRRLDAENDDELKEWDDFRKDRAKERQRDRNLASAAPGKRSRLQRDRERDISEMIALGMPSTGGSQHLQFDQRLFNQSRAMPAWVRIPSSSPLSDGPMLRIENTD